ncbi:MAG: alpha-N-acetylglucosaminidase TIM-barrel domain-containing protein [Planctomycetota bacterium]|nr:alpha-N-acetylglucosaminidase TIM-barrel domain-containing protein [Planctomycetota bacterium]
MKKALRLICILFQIVMFMAAIKPQDVQAFSSEIEIREAKNIAVVCGSQDIWLNEYAAKEIGKYLSRMSGEDVKILSDDSAALSAEKNIIIVGNSSVNKTSGGLEKRKLLTFPSESLGSDGFLIKSIQDGDKKYLLLAGNNDRATLYAVYHYLDKFCEVGFFEDGDRIPKRKAVPFVNINIIEKPKFEMRAAFTWQGWEIPKKFQSNFWTVKEWRQYIDWAVKKKFNVLRFGLNPCFMNTMGDILAQALPQYKEKGPNSWPSRYRRERNQKIFAYARKRGLKIMYAPAYGLWPKDFEELKPFIVDEYFLPADNPLCKKYMGKIMAKIVEVYGTDHLYSISYASETHGLKHLFAQGLKEACEVVKSADPQAKILIDGWFFFFTGYTREETLALLEVLPKEDVAISDLLGYNDYKSPDIRGGLYHKYNYYSGREWYLGFIPYFAGEDILHVEPGLKYYIQLLKELLNDPKAKNCRGVGLYPENSGNNLMLTDLFARGFWDPTEITLDSFISDYTVRRYGRKGQEKLLRSLHCTAKGMELAKHSNQAQKRECGVYLPVINVILQPYQKHNDPRKISELGVKPLRDALEHALSVRHVQSKNRFYESDLVELFKTYANELYHLPLLRLSDAYFQATLACGENSDADISKHLDVFDEEAAKMSGILDELEKVLSTREDYSLAADFSEIMSVPGTREDLIQHLKRKHLENVDGYCRNMTFETLHFVYIPEKKALMDTLRGKLKNKERTLIEAEDKQLKERLSIISDNFVNNDITVKDKYKGSTVEAVWEAYQALTEANCTIEDYSDLFASPDRKRYVLFADMAKLLSVDVDAAGQASDEVKTYQAHYAQQFQPTRSPILQIMLWVIKEGVPEPIRVEIRSDDNNKPGKKILGSFIIKSEDMGNKWPGATRNFKCTVKLNLRRKYWIYIPKSGNKSNCFSFSCDTKKLKEMNYMTSVDGVNWALDNMRHLNFKLLVR